jgi:hypothetical protein
VLLWWWGIPLKKAATTDFERFNFRIDEINERMN